MKKQNWLNLGPKMPYLGICDQECLKKKTIVRFEISTLKFVNLQNVTKKQKCLILGPKMPDFGISGLEFEGNIVIFEFNTSEFV